DSPLVTSLYEAYTEVTGDTENKPMVIGGGTYAKEIANTIAFGCAFPGNDYRIHNTNEWVKIDELLMQAEIYVHSIMKLAEL
ncbi:MAG: M20/M25/M40 family metallo-hydrolase, partial [Lachnospiraceae bacterium]|nr:M20/M25/M40 family metallo-hydrolase [Lachnospiraceae bacterium]